jgi:uncharacterized membrane protein
MKNSFAAVAKRISQIRGIDFFVLAGGIIVYTLVTLRTITASSIWFDEAFSAYLTKFSFVDIVRYTATDVHPPFYYWLLKIWTSLFGTNELAFRSMSLFFAAVAIVFGFLLVRRLFGRKAAWLSLAFLAVSPMLVRYGQEARMYTLVAAIGLAATYTLTFAVQSKRRRPWVIYGILVAFGMLTHYFMAFVWVTHWLWRYIVTRQTGARGKELCKRFFAGGWRFAHVIAICIFALWLPLMAVQLTSIQSTGFWIGSVGIDTLPGYVTNVLYYLEHGKATGWYGAIAIIVVTSITVFGIRLYKTLNQKQRQNYLLLLLLAVAPVVLLFVASLPPLKPSFVERYIMTSVLSFSLVASVTIVLGMRHLKARWQVLISLLIVGSMILGVSNVYYYGNYNKNSSVEVLTKQLVAEVDSKAKPGEPIIASSPWIFYEAVFYDTKDHPVYFINADTQYIYGSLDMLKYSNAHKINDLVAFTKEHPTVWYIGYTTDQTIKPARDNWSLLQSISLHDSIDNVDMYKAGEFKTN